MSKIEFPKRLEALLKGSELHPPIRTLADRVGEILTGSNLPFFPDYTDHGTEHINRVLESEVELVPKQVWNKRTSASRLLCDVDASVIIGSTLLHDIAMHLHPDGFLELISKDSRFQPLPWFNENHENHTGDKPWQELWEEYEREVRRFSDRELADIIGEESTSDFEFPFPLPEVTGKWTRDLCLIIGEFIRRHHARLAHEVAIFGFPGIPVGSGQDQFPALGSEKGLPLTNYADLIGLTARSHGMSLRVCKAYLDSKPSYSGPRPLGTAVLYPMALLRVADYLQIDRQRAPAVLLQLRNPQCPVSVKEWQKHRAVQNIGAAKDPRGKLVTVSDVLSLPLYLQLRDLLAKLQEEMDHSTAVLDESYGTRSDLGLDKLKLATRRVYSNLQSQKYRNNLRFVPDQTGFTADPNLLTLLIEPLYGKQPCFGVRELMQNAVDAVSELEVWCSNHDRPIQTLDLPEQDGDVLIEFIKREDGSWLLRVRDRGIGMSADTIQNYFLRAGASFRFSPEWAKEYLDDKDQPRVARAGRFGVGAFAVFLLGPSFKMWTRHASADRTMGYKVEATAQSQLIEIQRVEERYTGTTIEVELSSESSKALGFDHIDFQTQHLSWFYRDCLDWFCWDWPKVTTQFVQGTSIEKCRQEIALPIRKSLLPLEWSVIRPKGFDDGVYWTYIHTPRPYPPRLSCNGLKIAGFNYGPGSGNIRDAEFTWPEKTQLDPPFLAVVDNAANLPLTIQRDKLSQGLLPFIDDLARDVTLSFIAHSLVCGPTSYSQAFSPQRRYPLQKKETHNLISHSPSHYDKPAFSDAKLRWCITSTLMVPADPWLYTLLNTESCLVCGSLAPNQPDSKFLAATLKALEEQVTTAGPACISWHFQITGFQGTPEHIDKQFTLSSLRHLQSLAGEGIAALDHVIEASQLLVSASGNFEFENSLLKQNNRIHKPGWPEFDISKEEGELNHRRRWFEAKTGKLTSQVSLHAMLDSIESLSREARQGKVAPPDILYVSEINTKRVERSPESLLARIWYECLGAKAIPFDTAAREALIVEGCKHPELKRHIEAWRR